ncbi:MAG: hypothetical protein HRT90_04150 [Candidatus Margulisbacteria bacterium]|nr:hypothetical protein [Candidatus Margulisiibacteriota bacterium]
MFKSDIFIKWISLGLLCISLISALNIAARRYLFESRNTKIETVVSYRDISRLSILGGTEKSNILSLLKSEVGITSIAVEEKSISDLVNDGMVTLIKGSDITNMYRVGSVYRYILRNLINKISIKSDQFYLVMDENELYDRIKNYLNLELGIQNVREVGWNTLEVRAEKDQLEQLGVGIHPKTIRDLEGYGFSIIPRFQNSAHISLALIKLKLMDLNSAETITTIIFEGDSVLGYPDKIQDIKNLLLERHFNLGFIEFSNQLGSKSLAQHMPHSVIRVHSISENELLNMSQRKATNRYIRAAKERGIRILFLTPYLNPSHTQSLMSDNITFFKSITAGVKDLRLSIASFDKLPWNLYKPITPIETFIITLGVGAALLLLLSFFISLEIVQGLIILILFPILYLVFLLLGISPLWTRLMALASTITFPSLAIIAFFPKESQHSISPQKRLYKGILYLVIVCLLCLVGSLFVLALLSDPLYLLGIFQFYGVKISFLFPLAIIGIFFYLRPQRMSSIFYVIKRLFQSPVTAGGLMAVFIAILFVLVYILRSGNYIAWGIPLVEDQMRETLETLLFVRPRTKEFLIGYPFLLMGYLFVDSHFSRNWLWFFNVLGAIALISVINSFCHFHTPLIISLYRSVLGLLIGIGLGVFCIGIIRTFHLFSRNPQ